MGLPVRADCVKSVEPREVVKQILLLEKKGDQDSADQLLGEHSSMLLQELSRLFRLEDKWAQYVKLGQEIVNGYQEDNL